MLPKSSALQTEHRQEQTFPKGDELLQTESEKLGNVIRVAFHDGPAHPLKQGLEAAQDNQPDLQGLHLRPLTAPHRFPSAQTQNPSAECLPRASVKGRTSAAGSQLLIPSYTINNPPPPPPPPLPEHSLNSKGVLTICTSFTPPPHL